MESNEKDTKYQTLSPITHMCTPNTHMHTYANMYTQIYYSLMTQFLVILSLHILFPGLGSPCAYSLLGSRFFKSGNHGVHLVPTTWMSHLCKNVRPDSDQQEHSMAPWSPRLPTRRACLLELGPADHPPAEGKFCLPKILWVT